MHTETLTPKTKKVLQNLQKEKWIKDYYLAGGTALALQYGHRQSIDLDFFIEKNINTTLLIKKISNIGKFKLLQEAENTVEGILNGVKISFMTYPYALLKKKIVFPPNLYIASNLDIALMKLSAISSRNTKKDFIDLFCYLTKEKRDLPYLFSKMKKKYAQVGWDGLHACKALVYFVEADKEPMPRMIEKNDWDAVKKYFIQEIKKMSKSYF